MTFLSSGILDGVFLDRVACTELAPAVIRYMADKYDGGHDPFSASTWAVAGSLHKFLRGKGVDVGVAGVSPPKLSEWHTVEEVSSALGIAKQTVTKRCRSGSIRGAEKDEDGDGQWRISSAELERLVTLRAS